jgi:hypothetical protein
VRDAALDGAPRRGERLRGDLAAEQPLVLRALVAPR